MAVLIIAALTAVGLAIWLSGLLTGMAITREPLEDLLDGWPDERTGSYEYDHPVFRIVEDPTAVTGYRYPPADWQREGWA